MGSRQILKQLKVGNDLSGTRGRRLVALLSHTRTALMLGLLSCSEGSEEAGIVAGVTCPIAFLFNDKQQGVSIAVISS